MVVGLLAAVGLAPLSFTPVARMPLLWNRQHSVSSARLAQPQASEAVEALSGRLAEMERGGWRGS